MSVPIPIVDYEIKQPVLIADAFRIEVQRLELGVSVIIRVMFMKEESILLKEERVLYTDLLYVSGEEYARWGTDDSYLENLVIAKYGLERKSVS